MSVIETTISKDYCPTWGVWHGFREVMQNALDARDQGRELLHSSGPNSVTITTLGATLAPKAWLMGGGDKEGKSLRGKWGEGLKMGCLALIRAGAKVKIYTGYDVVVPLFVRHHLLKEEVLAFSFESVRADDVGPDALTDPIVGVRVEITDAEGIDGFLGRFLDLCPPETWCAGGSKYPWERDTVAQQDGWGQRPAIILDESQKGNIYVGGIWTDKVEALRYGYNFASMDLPLNRDRDAVSRDSLEKALSATFARLAVHNEETTAQVGEVIASALDDSSEEVMPWQFPHVVNYAIVEFFKTRHDDACVPVTEDERELALSNGFVPVIMSRVAVRAMYHAGLSLDKKIQNRKMEFVPMTAEDLAAQAKNVRRAKRVWRQVSSKAALTRVNRQHRPPIQFVDFPHNPGLQGTWNAVAGVRVSQKLLSPDQHGQMVITMIHELAHECGGDGTDSHRRAIEDLAAIMFQGNRR